MLIEKIKFKFVFVQILHYFLADDTLEIREVIPPNAGRDAVPVFLRRGRLPKVLLQNFVACLF